MKMTLVTLMVLVVALSTKALLGAAGPAPEPVLDVLGKKVRADSVYYIVPASSDIGGLASASTGKACPLDVVAIDGDLGLPLGFRPVNDKKGVVRVSTNLNIYFTSYTIFCPETSVWKLKDYDDSTSQWFVTTGGELGHPGSQTVANWFRIEKYEDAYKLVYCPSVCNDCSHQCSDIGIYQDQYGKRLALSSVPFKVQFERCWACD